MLKSLNIGGEKWKIIYKDIEEFGLIDIDNREIFIRCGLSEEDSRRTLFHEATHAAFHMSGLSYLFEDNQEEAIVRALDNLFYPAAKIILKN